MDAVVRIKGKQISPVNSFTINQTFNDHHTFECTFYGDVLGTRQNSKKLDQFKHWLGEKISIQLGDQLKFIGIVAALEYSLNPLGGNIIVTGYSPTKLLDTAIGHFESYSNLTFKDLVNKIRGRISDKKLLWGISKTPVDKIKYVVQYNETYFSFLKRLSLQYGVLFYYTGQNLHFGQQKDDNKITIEQKDCTFLDISAQVLPFRSTIHAYDYTTGKDFTEEVSKLNSADPRIAHLNATSDSLFKPMSSAPAKVPAYTVLDLLQQAKNIQDARSARLMGICGKSTRPAIALGKQLEVVKKAGNTEVSLGTFLITEIIHKYSTEGKYANDFKGISIPVKTFGAEDAKSPVAMPQLGVVLETHHTDPLKMGRVKVKLFWQAGMEESTDWLQVGSLWSGEMHRGSIFIPMVGDEVIVGFHHGNPDLPFVMGSVINSKRTFPVPPLDGIINVGAERMLAFNSTGQEKDITLGDSRNGIILDRLENNISIQADLKIEVKCGTDSSLSIQGKVVTIDSEDSMTLSSSENNLEVLIEVANKFEIKTKDYKVQAWQIRQNAS